MDTIIETIRRYIEGLLTQNEMDTQLEENFQIHGAIKGRDFAGYDYKNQAWLQIHLS